MLKLVVGSSAIRARLFLLAQKQPFYFEASKTNHLQRSRLGIIVIDGMSRIKSIFRGTA